MHSRLFTLVVTSLTLALSACTTTTSTPAPDKIPLPFMGFGNEPGWSVKLQASQPAEIQLNYGEQKLSLELPAAQTTYAGQHYRTTYQDQPLTIDIIKKSCNDTMSDNIFDYEVLFSITGQNYRGCGRQLK